MKRMESGRLIETPKGPMTRTEAAKAFGIARNTIIRRIWEGWPPERVFEKPKSCKAIYVVTKAGRYRLADLVRDERRRHTVAGRLRRGIPDHLAVDLSRRFVGAHIRHYPSPWGLLTLPGIAQKIGITLGGLRYRLQSWTVEEALNTPPFGARGQHSIMPVEEFRRRMKRCEAQIYRNQSGSGP